MSNGNGVSRGGRNRNARLSRLRVLVPPCNAIVGIDLTDNKQMVVVADHDSKVLGRRTFRWRAWDLGLALDCAGQHASKAGFAGMTVACEPTGSVFDCRYGGCRHCQFSRAVDNKDRESTPRIR
jgi:hypothetical protein